MSVTRAMYYYNSFHFFRAERDVRVEGVVYFCNQSSRVAYIYSFLFFFCYVKSASTDPQHRVWRMGERKKLVGGEEIRLRFLFARKTKKPKNPQTTFVVCDR